MLQNIWSTKKETARRLKQRLGKVLEWCKAQGHISGENAAAHVGTALGPRRQSTNHFNAVPHERLPNFVKALTESTLTDATKLGLLLTILTALRTNEVRLARWNEVDWDKKIWVIPSNRQLKKRKPEPHDVPLSPAAIAVLVQLKSIAGESEWLLPGRDGKKPICDTTLLVALKRSARGYGAWLPRNIPHVG